MNRRDDGEGSDGEEPFFLFRRKERSKEKPFERIPKAVLGACLASIDRWTLHRLICRSPGSNVGIHILRADSAGGKP